MEVIEGRKDRGLVTVVIDNPPINLITLDLYRELLSLLKK